MVEKYAERIGAVIDQMSDDEFSTLCAKPWAVGTELSKHMDIIKDIVWRGTRLNRAVVEAMQPFDLVNGAVEVIIATRRDSPLAAIEYAVAQGLKPHSIRLAGLDWWRPATRTSTSSSALGTRLTTPSRPSQGRSSPCSETPIAPAAAWRIWQRRSPRSTRRMRRSAVRPMAPRPPWSVRSSPLPRTRSSLPTWLRRPSPPARPGKHCRSAWSTRSLVAATRRKRSPRLRKRAVGCRCDQCR
jgi:hypothetical protein